MTNLPAGTLAQIWRYPVKSMGGELIDRGTVHRFGLLGDRVLAVMDRERGTLGELQAAAPASTFDVRRFRPSLLVEVPGPGFVENGWLGGTLAPGTPMVAVAGVYAEAAAEGVIAVGDPVRLRPQEARP